MSHSPHPCGAPATAIPSAEASPSARPLEWRAWAYGATSLRAAAPAGAWCHRDWEGRRQGGSADEIVLGMIGDKVQEYGLP
jgi:hypothetical protein